MQNIGITGQSDDTILAFLQMHALGSRRPLCYSGIITSLNGYTNSRYFITDVYGPIVWDFCDIYGRKLSKTVNVTV
jgi:hypothetical protein